MKQTKIDIVFDGTDPTDAQAVYDAINPIREGLRKSFDSSAIINAFMAQSASQLLQMAIDKRLITNETDGERHSNALIDRIQNVCDSYWNELVEEAARKD